MEAVILGRFGAGGRLTGYISTTSTGLHFPPGVLSVAI
jgi:hypothetical protein